MQFPDPIPKPALSMGAYGKDPESRMGLWGLCGSGGLLKQKNAAGSELRWRADPQTGHGQARDVRMAEMPPTMSVIPGLPFLNSGVPVAPIKANLLWPAVGARHCETLHLAVSLLFYRQNLVCL